MQCIILNKKIIARILEAIKDVCNALYFDHKIPAYFDSRLLKAVFSMSFTVSLVCFFSNFSLSVPTFFDWRSKCGGGDYFVGGGILMWGET
jgi:hypothetical protein